MVKRWYYHFYGRNNPISPSQCFISGIKGGLESCLITIVSNMKPVMDIRILPTWEKITYTFRNLRAMSAHCAHFMWKMRFAPWVHSGGQSFRAVHKPHSGSPSSQCFTMMHQESSLWERDPSAYWIGRSGVTRPLVGNGLDMPGWSPLVFLPLDVDGIGRRGARIGVWILVGMISLVVTMAPVENGSVVGGWECRLRMSSTFVSNGLLVVWTVQINTMWVSNWSSSWKIQTSKHSQAAFINKTIDCNSHEIEGLLHHSNLRFNEAVDILDVRWQGCLYQPNFLSRGQLDERMLTEKWNICFALNWAQCITVICFR